MRKTTNASACLPLFTVSIAISLAATFPGSSSASAQKIPDGFRPGQIWLDTNGHAINAHGGGILYHDDTYYWYGEIKNGRTISPESTKSWGGTRVDVEGVSCYSSRDLYNWKYEGNVLPAAKDDPGSDLHTSKVVERPKVLFNRNTKKFVMWLHIDSEDYKAARSGVAVCDTPTGKFRYLGSFRPNAGVWPINATDQDRRPGPDNKLARDFRGGQMARDMTLFMDDDGKAYHVYSSEDNATLHISELTDDYLRPSGKYARAFIGRTLEAAAVFKHEGKYYLIASECTGWDPNPAHSAVADSMFGPWRELGNPCVGKDAEKTFHAQSTYVLPVSGRKSLYILMTDRWNKDNLPDSRYAWLPIRFSPDGRIVVKWLDRWSWNESADSMAK